MENCKAAKVDRGLEGEGCREKQTTSLPIQCLTINLYYFYFPSYKEFMLSFFSIPSNGNCFEVHNSRVILLTSVFFSDAQHPLGYKSVTYYYKLAFSKL